MNVLNSLKSFKANWVDFNGYQSHFFVKAANKIEAEASAKEFISNIYLFSYKIIEIEEIIAT